MDLAQQPLDREAALSVVSEEKPFVIDYDTLKPEDIRFEVKTLYGIVVVTVIKDQWDEFEIVVTNGSLFGTRTYGSLKRLISEVKSWNSKPSMFIKNQKVC